MRLTVDEYCKNFKMSKEMVNSKIKDKKLDYVIEDGNIYITKVERPPKEDTENKPENTHQTKTNPIAKPKTTVATVIALYQRENSFLKHRIAHLEAKIDKLIDDKEQMLRAERDKIEQVYTLKDEQLRNILELVNKKLDFERGKETVHEIDHIVHNEVCDEDMTELKEYLRSLDVKSSQRKIIKKRFLDAYENDSRVIHKNGKLYLNLLKYDYSDLLAY